VQPNAQVQAGLCRRAARYAVSTALAGGKDLAWNLLLGASPSSLDLLYFLRNVDEHDASRCGIHCMPIVRSRVEIVSLSEVILAKADFSFQNKDLLATRMVMGRIRGTGLELQKDRRCPSRCLVIAKHLDEDARDTRLVEGLP
jgi:hypothetical protein